MESLMKKLTFASLLILTLCAIPSFGFTPSKDSQFNKGYLVYSKEHFVTALRYFNACVLSSPSDPLCRFYKAMTEMKCGMIRKAIEDFKETAKLKNNYAEAYYWLGILEHQVHEDFRAFESLEKAIEQNPCEAKYWAALASARKDLGESEEARADYEKALAFAPGLSSAHLGLAWLDFEQGKIDSALDHAEQRLLACRDPEAYHALACIISEKDLKKAAEYEGQATSKSILPIYQKRLEGFRQGLSYQAQINFEARLLDEENRKALVEKIHRQKIWERIVETNRILYLTRIEN